MKKYHMEYTKLGFKASGYYNNEKEARRVFKEIYGVEPDEITLECIEEKVDTSNELQGGN